MIRCLFVALLLVVAGCGPQRPTEFTVSGKPLEHWLETIKTGEVPVREKAVAALGNVATADPQVVPALADALQDNAPSVRAKAALALLKIGPHARAATGALARAAEDDADPDVRRYASKALAKVQGKE